ncbi:glycine-rich cell wall structural protein 1 [Pyrus x bretschneideri]|uniref:glycine-rich cell wall structural protein 1 n=1 Tax=Pyrus x bretschneideri TaxID=225117 RepID=UPI00051192C6|nr:glycine-rich cell wall structural protein 1 [Pyrus x bretschneideri]
MMGSRGSREDDGGEGKGWLWKLPVLKSQQLGKVGPAFGLGVGCGVGFGIGLLGGAGFGPGIPGLQVGFGLGAGCGVGLGFGYGVGKGIAYDDHRRYSNVGNLFRGGNVGISCASRNLPTQDDIGALVEELVDNTKKLVKATAREMDKWRR